MSDINKKHERPLSPHLQVYKLPITAIMSITNRIFGVCLVYGIVMVLWLLIATVAGEESYNFFMSFCTSIIGQIMLFGWSFALFYHMSNGIRHLIWDTGKMFEKGIAEKSGYIVIIVASLMTAATWYCALN